MRKVILLIITLLPSLTIMASTIDNDSVPRKKSFVSKIFSGVGGVLKEFNNIDTTYIEPQHYKFTTTFMSTYTFESYRITSKSGQEVHFSPEARVKAGPYIGWSLLFLGYTIDLAYISANKKKEMDLSVYTSMLGLDFFYRKSGHDYRIRSWDLGDGENSPVTGIPFDGLKVSITGLNGYYIANHRKFSYPAAFNQSTNQRKSCGSFMFGGGYTRHTLELDYHKLQDVLQEASPEHVEELDSGLLFNKIKYTDVSLSAGYGYNWVFSRNWLLSASLSAALGYKHSSSGHDPINFFIDDFSFSNFNLDGVGRMAITWNNTKWYFGADGIVHSYNYSKSRFATNNYFGNVRVYIGINFGRKKSHKKT